MKQIIKDSMKDLDEPIKLNESWTFLKKGKIRIIIIFEDKSFKEYYKKLKNDYFFIIKSRRYLIVPKCIILGKFSTLVYYYNNPMPIKFEFTRSKVNALDMTDKESIALMTSKDKHNLANLSLDSHVINTAFNSNLINKLYYENKMTPKVILITMIVVFIMILLILHFTGVINITEMLTGKVTPK